MKTTRDVLEYLQIEGMHLHNLIGEDDSEFNKGRIYVMNKITQSVKDIIEIEEYENNVFYTEIIKDKGIEGDKLKGKLIMSTIEVID